MAGPNFGTASLGADVTFLIEKSPHTGPFGSKWPACLQTSGPPTYTGDSRLLLTS